MKVKEVVKKRVELFNNADSEQLTEPYHEKNDNQRPPSYLIIITRGYQI